MVRDKDSNQSAPKKTEPCTEQRPTDQPTQTSGNQEAREDKPPVVSMSQKHPRVFHQVRHVLVKLWLTPAPIKDQPTKLGMDLTFRLTPPAVAGEVG